MLVLASKYGRLGNQLWTYANILSFSFRSAIPLVNTTFEDMEYFEGISALPHELQKLVIQPNRFRVSLLRLAYKINLRIKTLPFVPLGEDGYLDLDSDKSAIAVLSGSKITFFSGFYFSAPRSMHQYGLELRQFFKLTPSLQRHVELLCLTARRDADILIGVHIRHGDYRTYCQGIMYYSTTEYRQVMQSIVERNPEVKISFLICSDEKQDLSVFDGLSVIQSHEIPVVDMYALAQCDYIIAPNSSFSHWASFYGRVPLHILDYRAAEQQEDEIPVYNPDLRDDFKVFSPDRFTVHASREFRISNFLP